MSSIIYKYYIPEEIIEEFLRSDFGKEINFSASRDDEDYHNFTGLDLTAVTVFINQHKIELLVGLIGSAAYDVIKNSFIMLIRKVQQSLKDQKTSKERTKEPVTFKFKDNNRELVFSFPYNTSSEILNHAIDRMYEIINKSETHFNQTDFVFYDLEDEIMTFHYNLESRLWVPVNHAKWRKKLKKMEDELWNLSN